MGASQRCKEAEEIIKTETANVQQLKKLVNEKLDEVHNFIFFIAMHESFFSL